MTDYRSLVAVVLVGCVCYSSPCAFAYDWQMDFHGNLNYQHEEMLQYERAILSKVSDALRKSKLPADTHIQLEFSKVGYPMNVEVPGDLSDSQKKSVVAKIKRLKFDPNPAIGDGKVTLSFSLKELNNPPYHRDYDGIMGGSSGLRLMRPEILDANAQKEIEVAQGIIRTSQDKFQKLKYERIIVTAALNRNFGSLAEEHAIAMSNLMVDCYYGSRDADLQAYGLAALAAKFSRKGLMIGAAAIMRSAITIQKWDNTKGSGGCVRGFTITPQFEEVVKELNLAGKTEEADELRRLRAKQLGTKSSI